MIKKGDVVRIHYSGRFEDGEVFDSSEGRAPLEFTAGEGMVIKGLDEEIIGMRIGEKKTLKFLLRRHTGTGRKVSL